MSKKVLRQKDRGEFLPQTKFNNKVLFNIILIVVFAVGIFLRINFLNTSAFYPKGDENYYSYYATYMAKDPQSSVKTLVANYIDKEEWHVYPNPLRSGYILLSSSWMKFINNFSSAALLYMSCFFSILLLFLGYTFVKKLMGEKIALLSLILFAVSPLNLAMSKRILQDSAVYFFIILALYLFYVALKKGNILLTALFSLSFLNIIMLKETSVMFFPFFIVFALIEKSFFNKKLKILPIISSILAPLGIALLIYILLSGSLVRFIALVKIILLAPLSNEYVIKYQAGSFFRYIHDFFLLSPVTLIFSLFFISMCIVGKKLSNESYSYLIIFFVMLYTEFSLFNKNVRAVIFLDFPIRVLASVLAFDICKRLKEDAMTAALIIITLMAALDFCIYRQMFIAYDIYDPVNFNLKRAWEYWIAGGAAV